MSAFAMMTRDFEDVSTLSLEEHISRLALEASVLANLSESFSRFIPAMSTRFSELCSQFANTENHSEKMKEFTVSYREFQPKAKLLNFIDYRQALVSVPEGMNGELLSFVEFLAEHAGDVFNAAFTALDSFQNVLSAFVSNKDNKLTLSDMTHQYRAVKEYRERVTNKLSDFFDQNSSISKRRLGVVLARVTDITTLRDQLAKLDKMIQDKHLTQLSDKVSKISQLFSLIQKSIKEDGLEEISGAAAKNISEGAYEMAKLVELVSVFRFKIDQAFTSGKGLVEDLNRFAV